MEVFELDLFDMSPRLNCAIDGDFGDELVISTLIPVAVCAIIIASRAITVKCFGGNMIDEGSSGGIQYMLQVRQGTQNITHSSDYS